MVVLLRKRFFGLRVCTGDHPIKYCGSIAIRHHDYSISVHQEGCVDSLETIKLPHA